MLFVKGKNYFFLAVLADFTKSDFFGAPFSPGLRIFSPDPAAMRSRLALMFAYNPGLVGMLFSFSW
jgi:hypothetical protein